MITEIKGKCQYEECDKEATHIASGRAKYWEPSEGNPEPGCYCSKHATDVSNEGHPEYDVDCPNCGCLFGVN